MDPNFVVLLMLVGAAAAFGFVVALFSSEQVRQHGLGGALLRAFTGGGYKPYGH
jgi:hypothetical protein